MIEKTKNADKGLFNFVLVWECLILLVGIILAVGSSNFFMIVSALIVALYFWLDYYVAGYFYFIGVDKGYSDRAYLRFAFALNIIGYIMIAAMPDRGGNQQIVSDELPDL